MTFDASMRPIHHFTPSQGWMNDPNGLIFHDGLYHLYFQHDPSSITPGRPSWGHATSRDLLSWDEWPVALPSTEVEYPLSGSVVFDRDNTSGLATGTDALVACYTSYDPRTKTQCQSLAVSHDGGFAWEPYAHNPVLDIGSDEFRDPKVMWHDDSWLMLVVLAERRVVRTYRSPNLIDWTLEAEFGPAGFVDGVWECPDLFELPVEGTDESVAILLLSVQSGGPVGGSGMQYFVGDFAGSTFTRRGGAAWVDHGSDFYAAVSYADQPRGERIVQGWMNNWAYADKVPAAGFRGTMTTPRRLGLRERAGALMLVQRPILRELPVTSSVVGVDLSDRIDVENDHLAAVISVQIEARSARRVGVDVRVGSGELTRVLVDLDTESVTLDRTHSGRVSMPEGFSAPHTAGLQISDGHVSMDIVVDVGSVEVFAGDGEVVLTDLVFPSPSSRGITVFAQGGAAFLRSLTVSPLA